MGRPVRSPRWLHIYPWGGCGCAAFLSSKHLQSHCVVIFFKGVPPAHFSVSINKVKISKQGKWFYKNILFVSNYNSYYIQHMKMFKII